METSKPLMKDENVKDVDVYLYRSMIGSLIYLTSSRPNIMFAVCACARFQVTPKVSHLHAVKRIFRYLKGQPKLGLWYPKDSPFDLEAYTDSDYAGASLDRKSTTGGCQFLGSRLISWQCKKQTIVANSTTEAEYVAASNCCGQVLWIQNQMLDYGYNFMNTKIFIDNESTICIVKNPVFHSKTKHIKIRHHFIRDSYEKRLIQVIKIHTDHNVADLLAKAFDIDDWNRLEKLRMKFRLKTVTVGVTTAEAIFNDEYDTPSYTKKVFANMRRQGKDFSGTLTPLFPSILASQEVEGEGSGQPSKPQHTPTTTSPSHSSRPTTLVADEIIYVETGDSVERADTTAASLDAEHDSGNIIRTQSIAILNEPIPQGTGLGSGPRSQDTILGDKPTQTRFERLTKQSNDPPLSRVNILGSGEDSMKLNELMEICARLSERVLTLKNIKTAQNLEITNLKKRVKTLEKKKKARTPQLKRRLFKGRNEIDQDEEISWFQEDAETQGRYGDDFEVNTASTSITTGSINITIAEPKKSKEKGVSSETTIRPTRGVIMKEASETVTRPIVLPQQQLDPKDKGKGIMQEPEKLVKVKGKDQITFDKEVARRLEA
ncbi:hypothetical protein Tco_1364924 [Tanacetum coccineum]